jgi:hypothetical protein
LEFRILGPVDVIRNGAVIALDGSKQCTVLAALLLADGRVLSDSRLSYLLWGDSPPTTVHAQIYTYVSRLRKYLGPQVDICRRPPGYTMDIGALRFDLLEFEQLTGWAGRRSGTATTRTRPSFSTPRWRAGVGRLWPTSPSSWPLPTCIGWRRPGWWRWSAAWRRIWPSAATRRSSRS